MRAAVIYEHGGPEKLIYEADFPDPIIKDGSVIIAVKATSLNYHDVFTRRGMPGIKIPFPMIMGIDVAGEIIEIGDGVTGWSIGDRVLVDPDNYEEFAMVGETLLGGLAEKCLVTATQLIKIPDSVSFDNAASLPVAYGTAYRMMVTQGRISSAEKVVILGASGGVGTCCVQLAKIAGAEVAACASSKAKLEKLKKLGADHLINYAEDDIYKESIRVFGRPSYSKPHVGADVVINFTGGDTWVPSLKMLKFGGRLLTCGATTQYNPETDLRYIWTRELNILGSNGWKRSDLEALLKLLESKQIEIPIDKRFSLENAQDALAKIEDRKVFGKVIVNP